MEQEEIREIVRKILDEELDLRIARMTAGQEDEFNRLAVLQRLIRLEEELKAQRKLMEKQFEAMDKRFEDLIHYVDRRFTQLTWLISTMFVVLGTLITVFRFLG